MARVRRRVLAWVHYGFVDMVGVIGRHGADSNAPCSMHGVWTKENRGGAFRRFQTPLEATERAERGVD